MSSNLQLGFRSSDPIAHLGELQQRIRQEPQRSDLRVFLFQLYCVLGEWSKAATQLGVISELDGEALSMGQAYREVLRCEVLRREVFAGKRTPLVLGNPQDWLAWLLESNRLRQTGQADEARALHERALEAAPATAGTLNGEPFAWLADADSRLGPVLEAMIDGKYYWVPLHRLSRVEIDPPEDLRDLVWTPATLEFANGGRSVAFVPARYPGSEACDDKGIRLARATRWIEVDGGVWTGLGQRMFATDGREHALLDVREIVLEGAGDA